MGRLDEIFATQASLDSDRTPLVVLEGIIQAGSYDPTVGTVQISIGHTVAAASFNDGDQPDIVTAALATIGYGDQYGPVGNERALVLRAGTHYVALIEFGPDDSPNAPSGERWTIHRNSSGATDAYDKITNDGATAGDGKAGRRILVGEYAVIQTTGGLQVTLNDKAGISGQIELTAGSLTLIMDANTGTLQIGGSGTTSGDAIMRQSDIVSLLSSLATNLQTWANANFAGGTNTKPGPTMPSPAGSSKSFSA